MSCSPVFYSIENLLVYYKEVIVHKNLTAILCKLSILTKKLPGSIIYARRKRFPNTSQQLIC